MLEKNDYKEVTFEEYFRDALVQIPLYTDEWTNFNASDPGITILENMSAFNVLQQNYIEKLNEQAHLGLLKMAGINRRPGKSANVFLKEAYGNIDKEFPVNYKFYVGDLCFENYNKVHINGRKITDVFRKEKDNIISMNELLAYEVPVSVYVWGKEPRQDMQLYFIVNRLEEQDRELLFYVDVDEVFDRNKIEWKDDNPFAAIRWQLYSDRGFIDINAEDYSESFLQDGIIRLSVPVEKAAYFDKYGYSGYAIRAVLTKAEYDNPPRINNISGFIFEVVQRDSKAECYTFEGSEAVEINSELADTGYFNVYCKKADEEYYYKYKVRAEGEEQNGHFYTYDKDEDGKLHFNIAKDIECGQQDSDISKDTECENQDNMQVKIVVYDEDIMRQYHLDKIYGYDNQEITLPVKNINRETFELIVKMGDDKEDASYTFVKPDECEEGRLCYGLDEAEGKVYIKDAGNCINGELYMCSVDINQGNSGNIDKGKLFHPKNNRRIGFINVSAGTGGSYQETLEQMKLRFAERVNTPEVAVLAEDYEKFVMQTPGLAISKVKAIAHPEDNSVHIVVLPATRARLPRPSATYISLIEKNLEHYRMLTTKVYIDEVKYAAVDVTAHIIVKPHYTDGKKQIEEAIKNSVDYIRSNRNFGELLRYEDVYRSIKELECVDDIIELKLNCADKSCVEKQELNLKPADICLLYSGYIHIKTNIH